MIKASLVVIWVLIAANLLFTLPAILVMPLHAIGLLLAVAHIVEYFIFRAAIKAKGDGEPKSFIMTFLFGVAYVKNLK